MWALLCVGDRICHVTQPANMHRHDPTSMSSFDGVWCCQLCNGIYVSLSKLVGHARGSHQYLNVKCGVSGCNELMSSAASWYKHIRLHHEAGYYDAPPEILAEPEPHHENEFSAHKTTMDLGDEL